MRDLVKQATENAKDLDDLLCSDRYTDLTRDEVHQIIATRKWGKVLSDMQRSQHKRQAHVARGKEVTVEKVNQMNVVKLILSVCTNVCPNCGYEATVYNFTYCPICSTKAIDGRRR